MSYCNEQITSYYIKWTKTASEESSRISFTKRGAKSLTAQTRDMTVYRYLLNSSWWQSHSWTYIATYSITTAWLTVPVILCALFCVAWDCIVYSHSHIFWCHVHALLHVLHNVHVHSLKLQACPTMVHGHLFSCACDKVHTLQYFVHFVHYSDLWQLVSGVVSHEFERLLRVKWIHPWILLQGEKRSLPPMLF